MTDQTPEPVRKMTTLRFAQKVAWEGGITATLDYGISPDEIEDPEVRACWDRLRYHYDAMHDDILWLDMRLRRARRDGPTAHEDEQDTASVLGYLVAQPRLLAEDTGPAPEAAIDAALEGDR